MKTLRALKPRDSSGPRSANQAGPGNGLSGSEARYSGNLRKASASRPGSRTNAAPAS